MKNFSIKVKLILIFILIKVIPLLIVSYIAYKGAMKLNDYLHESTKLLFNESKEIILNTANESINDSIKNLDKKSQLSLERISYEIANNIAQFLYQRDEDILFLSKLDINNKVLENFYNSKKRDILVHGKYIFDEKNETWVSPKTSKEIKKDIQKAKLKDNEKEFNFVDPLVFDRKAIPVYKEVSFFDLNGQEKYKVSQINPALLDVSKKQNTYINAENYFNEISTLKKDEIYVSNVIGEVVPTKVIGKFTKAKAKKLGIEFEPSKYAYAGKENPNGKKFEGIIRFITPVFKENKKIGYLSLALDHEHIMQFTDTSNPTSINAKQNIADASEGNYAFMWDYKGRSISHPRDYFIFGYDKKTGKEIMPWLSLDVAEKFKKSNKDITTFLKDYPKFENQSLKKKPYMEQFKKDGILGLDCKYLNFAPQCQGWMQVTKNGGYGSFIIFWSNVWKLTTAATIPYYTGQYGSTKRGFGFVTIGANVDEFHAAANKTRENVNIILETQSKHMQEIVKQNNNQIEQFIKNLINELSLVTFLMVIFIIAIALWLSSYISGKIQRLLLGTKKFSQNEFNYRIKVDSNDEIGELENSFNDMAFKIDSLIKEQKELNESLEQKVEKEIEKRRKHEEILFQQSRLASMGEMIGNIAHQWRQPLNTLGLVIQNLKFVHEMGTLDKETMDKSVTKSRNLIENMSKTIDDFRNFFKPNKLKEKFCVNENIKNAISLLTATLKYHDIKVTQNLFSEVIYIDGYSNEFSQALLNILKNAKDALLENKIKNAEITIITEVLEDDVKIVIRNNGKNIDEKIISKVFDPYFTTKLDSHGTGVGLYMTKTIIEDNMLGEVYVQNIDDGVEFIIKMPKYKER